MKAYHVKCLEENDISLKNVESLICGKAHFTLAFLS